MDTNGIKGMTTRELEDTRQQLLGKLETAPRLVFRSRVGLELELLVEDIEDELKRRLN